MSKARNIADAFDANGDVAVSALDNVPPNTALVDSSDNTVLDTSSGVLSANGQIITSADGISMQDNERIYLGNSDDLQIYHDGNHSRIVDSGTGSLVVQATDLIIQDGGSTEQMARFYKDAQVDLSYNGSTRLSTTSTGAKVWGDLDVTGDIIGGGSVLQAQTIEWATPTNAGNLGGGTGYASPLNLTLTAKGDNSKFFITMVVFWACPNPNVGMQLVRDTSVILGDNVDNYYGNGFMGIDQGDNVHNDWMMNHTPYSYLDSPSKSAGQTVNYRMYMSAGTGSGDTFYFNRAPNSAGPRAVSQLVVMEIAQ